MDSSNKKLIVNVLMILVASIIISFTICLAHHEISYISFGYGFKISLIALGLITIISVASDYAIFKIIRCKFKFWDFYSSMLPLFLVIAITAVIEFLYIKERIILQIIAKLSGCILAIYTAYIVHKKYNVEKKKCFIYLGITFILNLLPSLL